MNKETIMQMQQRLAEATVSAGRMATSEPRANEMTTTKKNIAI